jgi:hypothetical protein
MFRPRLESLDDRFVPAAHFLFADSSLAASGALVVDFKEAGLGNNQNIDYELTGDLSATFGFVNKGGNLVQGDPWLVSGTTLAEGTFSSGKNGNVTATLTSEAPAVNLKQPHGRGWTFVQDIAYTNLVLTDTTNDVSIDVPDASLNTFPA